ncbi:MAG TPA: FprA family A-type flavoprotein [Candidatus Omnitrophota bacterium]|nr:FprA family A-type flavoprotein [Candidatus Omnitrophota bacterium]HPS20343.1 FprA family A-type flavoprotein [Candidatus Omnitrophota bacterium]
MRAVEIKKNIYWVGGIDWDLRNFHGYITPRGSTYNAYLIIDKKVTLVDTVKHYLFDEMMERIKAVIDPSRIDYIVSNHVEMDHSGALPMIAKAAPQAVILTSPNGVKGLRQHFGEIPNLQVVDGQGSINIGERTLKFALMQMVHWPDSMATYIPEDKLLLPNDAFGQHIATSERFDDEIGWDIVSEEAAKYYGNIVLPYGRQVDAVLKAVATLDVDMIAPSHGLIWRKYIPKIVECYGRWANNVCKNKATVVYDTMWDSTRKIAVAIERALDEKGISFKSFNLKHSEISEVMSDVLESKYVFIGSSTLNNNMLPTVAGFLTYMKGLAPKNRTGLAFGSYGWGGQSIDQINEVMKAGGFTVLDPVKVQYIPTGEILNGITEKIKEGLK